MDLIKDFNCETLDLSSDYEGSVQATLISSKFNQKRAQSVLFIHGYIDYFFHPHLAEEFHKNGFDFHAIDLRKYGRSLLDHQHPNYCKNIEEYFEEISLAIQIIKKNSDKIFLLGHSTGGLIASCYMNKGLERGAIAGLILNSPFLDFNQTLFEKSTSLFFAKILSKLSVYSKINGALSPVNSESIHKDHYGEWDFNKSWKPIKGFPTYFNWIVAISNAQKSLIHSKIEVPILLLHSSRSKKMSKFTKEAFSHDVVLNIEDMKRIGPNLGQDLTFSSIDKAMHDVFLSPEKVRNIAFEQMFNWLSNQTTKRK